MARKTKRKTAKRRTTARKITRKAKSQRPTQFCSTPQVPERELGPDVNLERASLIRPLSVVWANGTRLHYYFFRQPKAWSTSEKERDVVRKAFDVWKNVGIGLEFEEVDTPDEAEVRIGFLRNDGAWSYLGRDVLGQGITDRTMNFGWDITRSGEIDTAIHEIGHTLGFSHEHQNPIAGIVWDEEAVYAALAKPPNNWSREKTFHNIIRKISPDEVQGSSWDPDSIMHYPFEPGLIRQPVQYQNGLQPAPGLSERDRVWALKLYPKLNKSDYQTLSPFQFERLNLAAGEQVNFEISPNVTRKYTFSTFGTSDTVMVLFEDVDGSLRYRTGDDDSGYDRNARFERKLYKGRRYVLRIRLYYRYRAGDFGILMW